MGIFSTRKAQSWLAGRWGERTLAMLEQEILEENDGSLFGFQCTAHRASPLLHCTAMLAAALSENGEIIIKMSKLPEIKHF